MVDVEEIFKKCIENLEEIVDEVFQIETINRNYADVILNKKTFELSVYEYINLYECLPDDENEIFIDCIHPDIECGYLIGYNNDDFNEDVEESDKNPKYNYEQVE